MAKDSSVETDLASIRDIMERSTRFISLSGMSGVLAGVFGLLGSAYAYAQLYAPGAPMGSDFTYSDEHAMIFRLLNVAGVVLVASLAAGILLTKRKAERAGHATWDNNAKRLVINMGIPLVAGGIFIIALLGKELYSLTAPASLLFYGMALVNASNFTLRDVRYLGLCETGLGLFSALFPEYGLLAWATGFGVLHVVYGLMMYNKYDR